MKKMSLIFLVSLVLVLSGCDQAVPPPIKSSPTHEMSTLELNNSFKDNHAENHLEIEGESFKLVTSYTSSYSTADWKITAPKTISISAKIEGASDDVEVFMEHVHIDFSIAAGFAEKSEGMTDESFKNWQELAEQIDGWKTDSMDDSFHGSGAAQPGFLISNKYPYEEKFAVEGYGDRLTQGWGQLYGYYTATSFGYTSGSVSIKEDRITEESLRFMGVYGNTMTVIYNLAIRNPGEEHYHIRAVEDHLFIPLPTQE